MAGCRQLCSLFHETRTDAPRAHLDSLYRSRFIINTTQSLQIWIPHRFAFIISMADIIAD